MVAFKHMRNNESSFFSVQLFFHLCIAWSILYEPYAPKKRSFEFEQMELISIFHHFIKWFWIPNKYPRFSVCMCSVCTTVQRGTEMLRMECVTNLLHSSSLQWSNQCWLRHMKCSTFVLVWRTHVFMKLFQSFWSVYIDLWRISDFHWNVYSIFVENWLSTFTSIPHTFCLSIALNLTLRMSISRRMFALTNQIFAYLFSFLVTL